MITFSFLEVDHLAIGKQPRSEPVLFGRFRFIVYHEVSVRLAGSVLITLHKVFHIGRIHLPPQHHHLISIPGFFKQN